MALRQKPGKKSKTDDQRLQSWMDWYDRNQQRSEYRRQRYLALTEEQREERRVYKREQYAKRVAEGWSSPVRKNRTDHMVWRELVISFLIARDGNICGICGKEVPMGDDGIDHIIPRNMGGPNTAENVRLTHRICNNRRPKQPKEIRLLLEATASKEALS
jgi:5-methylcytosine-specific restriction endonuclease McrA